MAYSLSLSYRGKRSPSHHHKLPLLGHQERVLYPGTKSSVLVDGEVSGEFEVKTGVLQGDNYALTLQRPNLLLVVFHIQVFS